MTDFIPYGEIHVSIHAPVMDANSQIGIDNRARLVSIHAPVMDAKR